MCSSDLPAVPARLNQNAGSGRRPQAAVGNLPVNTASPGLLPHPAGPPLTLDQLEGGQVGGMVAEKHETAWTQQRHHLAIGLSMGWGRAWKTGLGHGLELSGGYPLALCQESVGELRFCSVSLVVP